MMAGYLILQAYWVGIFWMTLWVLRITRNSSTFNGSTNWVNFTFSKNKERDTRFLSQNKHHKHIRPRSLTKLLPANTKKLESWFDSWRRQTNCERNVMKSKGHDFSKSHLSSFSDSFFSARVKRTNSESWLNFSSTLFRIFHS